MNTPWCWLVEAMGLEPTNLLTARPLTLGRSTEGVLGIAWWSWVRDPSWWGSVGPQSALMSRVALTNPLTRMVAASNPLWPVMPPSIASARRWR
jgi:hypothetical protein